VENPVEYRVAKLLVRLNIAYPVKPPRRFKPQLTVYRHLLAEAVKAHRAIVDVAGKIYEIVTRG